MGGADLITLLYGLFSVYGSGYIFGEIQVN